METDDREAKLRFELQVNTGDGWELYDTFLNKMTVLEAHHEMSHKNRDRKWRVVKVETIRTIEDTNQ